MVLTDYRSAARGARPLRKETAFLSDLDLVFPGSGALASGVTHFEHWPSNSFALGSYTCYTPGQFTAIAGNEGKPVDNLFFAGEHANSFYVWQGSMEGACLSGLKARRSAWCTKAELSDRADSETPRRLPHADYVLHRPGCSQEDDQLLREGWQWHDSRRRHDPPPHVLTWTAG